MVIVDDCLPVEFLKVPLIERKKKKRYVLENKQYGSPRRACKDKLICPGKAYSSLPVEGMDGRRDFYPGDAGYEMGTRTKIRYLVASVHYNVKRGESDTSNGFHLQYN
jgi:hypothetical protein